MKRTAFAAVMAALAALATGCADERLVGVDCRWDIDCAPGNVCLDRTCQPRDCQRDGCPLGEACIDNGCVVQCGNDGESCDDGYPCTTGDRCMTGVCTPSGVAADGTTCLLGAGITNRAVCRKGACALSICGDGFVDRGASPPEECDDGNTASGDGCEGNCQLVPPTLLISYPPRGATLDGSAQVEVRGVVSDAWYPVVGITVNGLGATLATNGTWTFLLNSQRGLNAVEVVATNGAGKTSRATVGYYYSPHYLGYSVPETTTPALARGLAERLSQESIDDRDHPCALANGVYGCSSVDDLATLGEIALNNLDLKTSVGSLPIYLETVGLFAQDYGYTCADCLTLPGFTVSGTVAVTGDVVFKSEITALDFNGLKLALTARAGGLDARVSVEEQGAPPDVIPGFSMTVRTSVHVPLVAKFAPGSVEVSYEGVNGIDLVCLFYDPDLDDPSELGYLCPHGTPLDTHPLASANPGTFADSGLTIGSMVMDNTFNISAAPGGGVRVELVRGQVDFRGSLIEVDPVQNLVLDLGSIGVLGLSLPLGQIPLTDLLGNVDTILNLAMSALLTGLQVFVEPAVGALLLTPDDPLSVGQQLKNAIESLAPSGTLVLAPFAGQTAAPRVQVASTVSAIDFAAPTGSNLLTGGMVPRFDLLFSSAKSVQRSPLGTPLAAGCYGDPEPGPWLPETVAAEQAWHVDAINQALFATWWAGGFDMPFDMGDLAQALPAGLGVSAFQLTSRFLAAPLLGNCGGAAMSLQVADARVAGSFTAGGPSRSFEAYVSAKVPVAVVAASGAAALQRVTTTEPQILVEVVSGPGLDSASNATLTSLLRTVLAEEILLRYSSAVMAALPPLKLDLSKLASVGNAKTLTLQAQSAVTGAGHTVLSGAMGQ